MQLVLVSIIITLVLIISIFIGYYLSYKIIDTTEYVLFWFMYILSLLTLFNIVGAGYYYASLKNKVGPRGPRGPQGDAGEVGASGQCSVSCRNNSCQLGIQQKIIDTINTLERSYGDPGDLTVETDLRNPYIKEKIKAICNSEEYQQMAPIKGVEALIQYLESIWVDITTRLYKSGGVNYFRTIGAEYDWDWLDENPWDEFKKYDVYYWGMGKEYRPRIIEAEIEEGETSTDIQDASEFPVKNNRFAGDNEMATPGSEMQSTTEQKDVKYSILGYVNIPATEADGKTILASVKSKLSRKIKLYNVHTFTNSDEILSQYSSSLNIRYLNPLSFMVVSPENNNNNGLKCIKYNEEANSIEEDICNSYEPAFVFHIEMEDAPEGRLMEFKLKHTASDKYLQTSGDNYILTNAGTVFTFAKE
jgi:hypothetical protein